MLSATHAELCWPVTLRSSAEPPLKCLGSSLRYLVTVGVAAWACWLPKRKSAEGRRCALAHPRPLVREGEVVAEGAASAFASEHITEGAAASTTSAAATQRREQRQSEVEAARIRVEVEKDGDGEGRAHLAAGLGSGCRTPDSGDALSRSG